MNRVLCLSGLSILLSLHGWGQATSGPVTATPQAASTPATSTSPVSHPGLPGQGSAVSASPVEVYKEGAGVSPPVLTHSVQPKYSKTARKQRLSGKVIVELVVDASGLPQNVRVEDGTGTELDGIALSAVQQYRFKPAMRGGEPVPVKLYVEVNFQIQR